MPARALAALSLCACNFEVPSSSYLVETKLLSVLIEVVELGPLNPERVGVASDVPIAEPMPHDRLKFEAFVVDRNGERIPTAELESLWFQCGPFECGEVVIDVNTELFDRDCDDLEDDGLPWNMDAVCRLGQGNGEFEFQVPELGQLMTEQRVAQYYGVIAWAGRTAESCWSARRAAEQELDNCGFIQRSVKIGPSWWMLVYAETIGLQSPIPLEKIPAGVYIQAANRVPIVSFPVLIDGELRGTWPEQTKFEVEPGAKIRIDSEYDEISQFLQTYFVARYADANFTDDVYFEAAAEIPGEVPYTSNAIVWIEFDLANAESPVPLHWDFAVDDYAEPGTSRILFVYFDDRYGEGVATLEFEVQS
jgi:hypothetical protein